MMEMTASRISFLISCLQQLMAMRKIIETTQVMKVHVMNAFVVHLIQQHLLSHFCRLCDI